MNDETSPRGAVRGGLVIRPLMSQTKLESKQMFHIVAINEEGVRIIGPFQSEEAAATYGGVYCEDPRWNVVDMGEPASYGMVGDENLDQPFFALVVQEF